MTRTFHIVGKTDRPRNDSQDATVLSRDKKEMGSVKLFHSPSGKKTGKAKLEGYWIMSDEELKELKK